MILPFRDCQVAGASPKGVGGRMADVLAAGSQKLLRDEDLSIQESKSPRLDPVPGMFVCWGMVCQNSREETISLVQQEPCSLFIQCS